MRKEMEHKFNETQRTHHQQMDELNAQNMELTHAKQDMAQQINQLKQQKHTLQQQNDALNANALLRNERSQAHKVRIIHCNKSTMVWAEQLQAIEANQTKYDQMKPIQTNNHRSQYEIRSIEEGSRGG
eukprot:101453_1